jgi:hypothetical protein
VSRKTNEEKLADIVSNYISDLRFDLEVAGKYLAWYLPAVAFRRLMIILEVAKEEREGNDRNITRK